jgi:hypothetical protein
MSSQVAVLKPRRQRAVMDDAQNIVQIATFIDPQTGAVDFNVPPNSGVTPNPDNPLRLEVATGGYFLQFNLTNTNPPITFANPAAMLTTPVGVLSIAPSLPTQVTIQDANSLAQGQSRQDFPFTFFYVYQGKIHPSGDPTIVNTPDPG